METRWTKGPYTARRSQNDDGFFVTGAEGYAVATVWDISGLRENIANRDLVLASPALADAAKPIVARLNEVEADHSLIAKAGDETVSITVNIGELRALRAALSLALGTPVTQEDGGAK